ncbi:FCS-Like Zinc finger 8-like [Malania oleifera]|uniref:FCS-Like Zinc finger 8-like n=1 Tax=Malania oleifera TaxID=397392 RepID=UPI0025AE360F|nr:FCS-Like Zinc finger 8-like [Malania oleifera]XP_057964705.1 FCS-Like Zinc finger 8-like [Malania oleifera]
MLRNRTRAVTGKQAVMQDHSSRTSPTQNYTTPNSPFFASPRLFRNFKAKNPSDRSEAMMSPTSILDTKPVFPPLGNPFLYDKPQSKLPEASSETKHFMEKLDSRGIGLALVHSLDDEEVKDDSPKPRSKKVLFGSHLKIQIPPLRSFALSPTESPISPADFGIKTRNSQIGSVSPFGTANSHTQTKESPAAVTGFLTVSEMEHSEDYTCVISHGPNPKTTHIFDDCVVQSCYGEISVSTMKNQSHFPALKKESHSFSDKINSPSHSFLSFCHTCKRYLGQEKDIFMYRGEKAFCSRKCRYQELVFDGVEDCELDDAFRTCS